MNALKTSATEYLKRIPRLTILQSLLMLAIRLIWGWGFFQAGKGKLMDLEKTSGYFRDNLHIPFPTFSAFLSGNAECWCGLLLLIGLASRLASVPLIITMCVAYATAFPDVLKNIIGNFDAFLSADPFLFLLASLLVLAFGPGFFSMDYVLGRTIKKE